MKGCAFTGHRAVSDRDVRMLSELLPSVLERAYAFGIRSFYSGGALGFDTLAAEAVIALRARHPDVELIMLLPCKNQDARWSAPQKARYRKILSLADSVEYISDEYDDGCMRRRNRELVVRAKLIIAYMQNERSGTAMTVKMAREGGRAVWNLCEHIAPGG